MKIFLPKRRQLACRCFLAASKWTIALIYFSSLAEGDVVVRWHGDWPAQSTGVYETALKEQWKNWESRLNIHPNISTVIIEKGTGPRLSTGGLTSGTSMRIHPRVSRTDFHSVLIHEWAHVFLNSACPRLQSQLLQEVFAQVMSGDYRRLSYEKNTFAYGNLARRWLEAALSSRLLEHTTPTTSAQLDHAVARLLIAKDNVEDLTEFFKTYVRECPQKSSEYEVEVLRRLGSRAKTPKPQSLDFYALDATSGEVIAREGDFNTPFPAGSVLKPLLVATVSEITAPVRSRVAPEWMCPHAALSGAETQWSWDLALAHSCNGFFLDHARVDIQWSQWQDTLKLESVKPPSATIPVAIGLVPGLEVSVRQVADLYRWMAREHPVVIAALKSTPTIGTLSGLTDSQWFTSQRVALKSGTVRTLNSEPEHGWIAAVTYSPTTNMPLLVAVIHSKGRSPHTLLHELRERISQLTEDLPLNPVTVQILALMPLEKIKWRCEHASWNIGSESAADINGYRSLRTGQRVSCLNGPIRLRFPLRSNRMTEREYWGAIDVLPKGTSRSGLVLRTSEHQYIASVLASEFAQARGEVMKALSLVIANNIRVPRHGDLPLCDTTHCQVFSLNSGRDVIFQRRIREALKIANTFELRGSHERPGWLSFSAGGENRWEIKLSSWELARRLGLVAVQEIKKTTASIVINGQPMPCESFRNHVKLLSCPLTIEKKRNTWIFKGMGEGHGLGLDLIKANARAAEGMTYTAILNQFYPDLSIVSRKRDGPVTLR